MSERKVSVGLMLGQSQGQREEVIEQLVRHFDLTLVDFVLICLCPQELPRPWWRQWAGFFATHRIGFAFLYSGQRCAPPGRRTHLDRELVAEMKSAAGEFYRGDMLGELGGLASWMEGYYEEFAAAYPEMVKPLFAALPEAVAHYDTHVRALVDLGRDLGVPAVMAVEATALSRYNQAAGVDIPGTELLCGSPEVMCASVRGSAKAYGSPYWFSHIATEWYGGFDNKDEQKYQRMRLAYYFSYLAGADLIYPESGLLHLDSFVPVAGAGTDQSQAVTVSHGADSPLCQRYRAIWEEFARFAHTDVRPAGGPLVRVAFFQGRYDSWSGWGGSTVWNRFGDAAWAYGPAEACWRQLDRVHQAENWQAPHTYGQHNLSGNIPCGLYDLLPAEAPIEVMRQYGLLVFMGWNTMNGELHDKLVAFVQGGGRLFAALPHFAVNEQRGEAHRLYRDGDLAELLGLRVSGGALHQNTGAKFVAQSGVPGYRYHLDPAQVNDPICAGDYVVPARLELCGARPVACLANRFGGCGPEPRPLLLEHALGSGTVTTLAVMEYPGHAGMAPFLELVLRALLAGEMAAAPVQVLGGDRLRHALYDAGDCWKVYLLNTDTVVPGGALLLRPDGTPGQAVSLAPGEMTSVLIPKA